MQYAAGAVGRVLMARFDHGEAILPAITRLCEAEKIHAGWFFLFGAASDASLVTGPREHVLPPDPVWRTFSDPHEIVGMGSVALRDGVPAVHLHAAFGRGDDVLAGCLRGEGKAYIVVEALLLELSGIAAARLPDPASGFAILSPETRP